MRQVQAGLEAVPGIERVEVNFGAGKARIAYLPGELTVDGITLALERLHHPGRPATTPGAALGRDRWWRRPRVAALAGAVVVTALGVAMELSHRESGAIAAFVAAVAIGIYFPLRTAIAASRRRTLGISTLLVVATVGALALRLWEEAALLVVIFSLGDVLEDLASDRARRSIRSLFDLTPARALVERADTDGEDGGDAGVRQAEVAVEEVLIGDVVVVRPGERFPVDGVILTGETTVDQAPITGESIPVDKRPGDPTYAGTLNGHGSVRLRVTRPSGDSTVSRIIYQVEEAQARKGAAQRFSERFGAVYTPAMFVLALATAAGPPLVGEPLRPWLLRGLTLLVVSCSCALVLSVPVSVVASISTAARRGILIKGGAFLEACGRLDAVVFDKTGTLTTGRPRITDIVPADGVTEEHLLTRAAALELHSSHPLGAAIVALARERGLDPRPPTSYTALPGLGAEGVCDGLPCRIGSPDLFGETMGAAAGDLRAGGRSVVVVAEGDRVLGALGLADVTRPDAAETVAALHRLGIRKVAMLTGDNEATARRIAEELGIDDVRSGLLPEDKVAALMELKTLYGTVAMVGDGVNDAPALAAADVGIAMGVTGSDVALETADVALMADDLGKLVEGVTLARRAARNLRQNVVMALASITLLVLAALAGYVTLVGGIALNEASALVVIGNGLRMLRRTPEPH